MSFLLRISSLIDWITDNVGRYLIWLLLGAVVISAGNAISRYAFSASNVITSYSIHYTKLYEPRKTRIRRKKTSRITSYNVCYTKLLRPMQPDSRSMNLSNAVAVMVYHAWGQQGFSGSV